MSANLHYVSAAEAHYAYGRLDDHIHRGSVVELSDGTGNRVFVRVLRVWRWRGRHAAVGGVLLSPGSVCRVVVAMPGGVEHEIDVRDPARRWGCVGVMVEATTP